MSNDAWNMEVLEREKLNENIVECRRAWVFGLSMRTEVGYLGYHWRTHYALGFGPLVLRWAGSWVTNR